MGRSCSHRLRLGRPWMRKRIRSQLDDRLPMKSGVESSWFEFNYLQEEDVDMVMDGRLGGEIKCRGAACLVKTDPIEVHRQKRPLFEQYNQQAEPVMIFSASKATTRPLIDTRGLGEYVFYEIALLDHYVILDHRRESISRSSPTCVR